jgi:hypothetical protein
MNSKTRLTIILLSWIFTQGSALAQGCSDAGFCTMGAMKPDQPFNKKIEFRLRSMEISFYRGTTPLTPVIYVATADMSFSLNAKTTFQVKVPYQAVTGSLGKTSGLGDLSLCLTRTLKSTEKFDINFTLGGKIATNSSNKAEDGRPLPMYYQTSLGTYDFITGISIVSPKWLFATGIQHPLNRNGNKFLWKEWENTEHDWAYIVKYSPAKKLKRGTDIMLRVERNFRFSRVNFSVGLLPIYRINSDKFTNADGKEVKPKDPDGIERDAKGLALSAIATVGYQFNVRTGIKVLGGHKIRRRELNPDGLTRDIVTSVSYFYRF